MPYISSTWCNLCNAGVKFQLNGRLDYYSDEDLPPIFLPEEYYNESITFTEENLLENSFRFSAASNQSGEVTGGGLVISSVSFSLVNFDISGYKAQPYRGRLQLQLWVYGANNTKIYLNLPTYYPTSIKERRGVVTIEAVDALDWTNQSMYYNFSATSFGNAVSRIFEDVRPMPGGETHSDGNNVEYLLAPSSFNRSTDTNINCSTLTPKSTTYAQILRWIAEACGVVFQLEVKQGSAALSGSPPDQQLVVQNANNTIPITADAVIDGDVLGNLVVVNSVLVSSYTGDARYSQNADPEVGISGNPFAYDLASCTSTSGYVKTALYSQPFYNFELTALCNPAIRPGDNVTFTLYGMNYTSRVESVEWTLGGYMTLKCQRQNQEDMADITPEAIGAWSQGSLPMTPTISASIGTDGTACATSTWLTQGSVTFEPGTYLILVNAFFSSNATGRRLMYFSSTSSGSALDGTVYDARMAVDGAASRLKFQTIKTFETSTTLYLRAWQNSGSSLTFTAEYSSIKIF